MVLEDHAEARGAGEQRFRALIEHQEPAKVAPMRRGARVLHRDRALADAGRPHQKSAGAFVQAAAEQTIERRNAAR
jgi:hypothetical protein